jgi:uncharacterized protein (TIGR02217 family)
MGFHEVQFPTDISYGARGGPSFSTAVIVLDSGAEERVARWTSPRYKFDASYGIKTFDQLQTVIDFYIARLGPAYGFRYKHWLHYTSASNGRDTPADTDVQIGVGDGTETDFQLIYKHTSGAVTRDRNIEKPVDGTTIISLDDVSQGSGWSVNTTTGIVTFSSAPSIAEVVKAGYEYDFPARFELEIDDAGLLASIDSFDSGSIPNIPIIEIKDERAIDEEYWYGGAYDHGNITSDVTISMGQGRVHTLTPGADSLIINLPDIADIPTGAPIWYLLNEGIYAMTIKDDGGGTIASLPVDGTAIVFVSISGATKSWHVK